MFFNNGIDDNVVASILNSIEWKLRFNVMQGVCNNSTAFKKVIPGGEKDSGKFEIESVPMTGGQKTTISWYRDESYIKFKVLEITKPQ